MVEDSGGKTKKRPGSAQAEARDELEIILKPCVVAAVDIFSYLQGSVWTG